MGGFTSRHFHEMFEALPTTDDVDQQPNSTPNEKNRSRFLSTDPRSPTNEVQRTPIQVEGTPGKRKPSTSNKYMKIGSAESDSPVPSQTESESDPFTDDDCKENKPALSTAQSVRPKKLSYAEDGVRPNSSIYSVPQLDAPALALRHKQIKSVTEEMLKAENDTQQIPE